MTTSEEILIIANRLANSGKKPTVALVKSRLSQSVPLALLINTLKNWQHEPDNTEIPLTAQESPLTMETEENKIELMISQAIEPLRQEINALRTQLENLKSQIDK
ncbi:hypothetical protein [Thalassotalea profundi]|nr:hypothetical protein [Thalassotalea profundi]